MMFSVPLYFQVTEGTSNAKAGSHLITIAAMAAIASYAFLLLCWHGHTNNFESLYIFPGGLGLGMASAATFIALTAKIATKDVAVATAGLYLAGSIGQVLGVSIGCSVQKWMLKMLLVERIRVPNEKEVTVPQL